MIRIVALLMALVLPTTLGGCAHGGQTPAQSRAASQLQSSLQAAVDAGQIPGAIAIVSQDGRELADVTVGYREVTSHAPLQRDDIFRLYSMSKPITSVAIMMLAEQGKLSLDDPAEKYLPEWRNMRVYVSGSVDDMTTEPARRPITIADLLTHTSGVTYHFMGDTPVHQYYRKYGVMRDTPVGRQPGDGPPARTLDELVARLGAAPMLHQPGETFAYSYSTTVLGAIIERVSGERLDRYLETHLFAPLQMEDTGFFVSDKNLPRFTTLYAESDKGLTVVEKPETSDYRDRDRLLDGGGAIAGTAEDYLRFAQMLANDGTLDGVRILTKASVDEMFMPRTPIDGLGGEPGMFGFGLSIGDAASAARGGLPEGAGSWAGSGNTYFFVDRAHGGVALVMTQVLGGGAAKTAVRDALNDAYRQLTAD